MEFDIQLTDEIRVGDRSAILDPLIQFNKEKVGDALYRPLNALLRNSTNKTIGGLWGHSAYGWCVVELLYVPETLRGQGVGSSLLASAETEAINRGCHGVWVDTHEFQARGFYEKSGFQIFGELPDYPPGYSRIFMSKKLDLL